MEPFRGSFLIKIRTKKKRGTLLGRKAPRQDVQLGVPGGSGQPFAGTGYRRSLRRPAFRCGETRKVAPVEQGGHRAGTATATPRVAGSL